MIYFSSNTITYYNVTKKFSNILNILIPIYHFPINKTISKRRISIRVTFKKAKTNVKIKHYREIIE